MNKNIIFLAIIVLIVGAVVAIKLSSSQSDTKVNSIGNNSNLSQDMYANNLQPNRVQVFLFHAARRCPTCIAIGRLAGETVSERFGEEVKLGKVEFREVNIDLPENKALAEKFQATGSNLYLNAIKNGVDNIETDVKVWSLTGDKEQFKDYLEDRINSLLGQ